MRDPGLLGPLVSSQMWNAGAQAHSSFLHLRDFPTLAHINQYGNLSFEIQRPETPKDLLRQMVNLFILFTFKCLCHLSVAVYIEIVRKFTFE